MLKLNKNTLIKILVLSILATSFSMSGCHKKEKDTLVSSHIDIKKDSGDVAERPSFKDSFEKAKQQNSDTVAWLNIPGTTINHPVVQDLDNKGSGDEDYYIHRNFGGQQVAVGRESAILSDKRNVWMPVKEMSNNIVISGHNVDLNDDPNGKMFAPLGHFKNIEFAKKTPYIFLTIDGRDLAFEVFASYYSELRFEFCTPKETEKEMAAMIKEAKNRSDFIYDVDVSSKDKVLTLYTCTYHFGGYRTLGYYRTKYVVQAKLLPDNAVLKTSANVKINPNKKEVNFSYCANCNKNMTIEKCSINGGLCDNCKKKSK